MAISTLYWQMTSVKVEVMAALQTGNGSPTYSAAGSETSSPPNGHMPE
jgi:hypothetical protein